MLSKNIQQIVLIDFLLFVLFVLLVTQYKLFFFILTSISIALATQELIFKLKNLDESKKKTLFRNELVYIIMKRFNKKKELQEEIQKIVSMSQSTSSYDLTKSELNVGLDIHLFMTKFTANLIEQWFLPHISKNERFPREAQLQLEFLFTDLFYSFSKVDKLDFFTQIIQLYNKNFLNIAIDYKQSNELPTDHLHPAIRNGQTSEIAYMRRFVQIVLRKSAYNLNVENQFVEDFIAELN